MASERKLLGIYLNDHWAGSTAGRELAKRAAGSNTDNELGAFLTGLLAEIEEDRDTLREVMAALGLRQDRAKAFAARAAERAGRLKLNGSLTGYSPLSRLVEIEGLALGIEGKRSLWRTLGELGDPALAGFDFEALEARAAAQREGLEAQRLEAARIAFERA